MRRALWGDAQGLSDGARWEVQRALLKQDIYLLWKLFKKIKCHKLKVLNPADLAL